MRKHDERECREADREEMVIVTTLLLDLYEANVVAAKAFEKARTIRSRLFAWLAYSAAELIARELDDTLERFPEALARCEGVKRWLRGRGWQERDVEAFVRRGGARLRVVDNGPGAP